MEPEINQKALVASADKLGFATYDRVLFQDLDLNIKMGEVTAITGKSGSGKTVILRILAGEEKQQEGKVFINPRAKVIFVPQKLEDVDVDKNQNIRDLFKDARGLSEIETKMAEYEARLADQKYDEKTVEEYNDLSITI
ncbi:MAG: ABC transporter ATP-binding protein [Patescibacteria group bacterium]